MERETKILLLVAAAVLLAALLLTFGSQVREQLAPEPRAAWVAIAPAGDTVAVSGPLEIEAGRPFTLYAVLEAEGRGGERLFYTEASGLRIGGEEIPPESLRPWRGGDDVRVLWFTVEGGPPYLEVAGVEELERLQFRELFRPDWPQGWSVPGTVEPSRVRLEAGRFRPSIAQFGSQSYHVRIEFFGPGSTLVPRRRLRSGGAPEIVARADDFPTVRALLPGPLAASSAVFGTPQLELAAGASEAVREEVRGYWSRRLAFSRLLVLRAELERAGASLEGMAWRTVDLEAGPPWGPGGAAPGDLLRVGERFVILVADEGEAGRLDRADLAFDFDKGAALWPLEAIFTGEGLVEWAPLGGAAR